MDKKKNVFEPFIHSNNVEISSVIILKYAYDVAGSEHFEKSEICRRSNR